jgi:hypothetical protein
LRRFAPFGHFRTFSDIGGGSDASASLASFPRVGANLASSISPAALRIYDHKRAAREPARFESLEKPHEKILSSADFASARAALS